MAHSVTMPALGESVTEGTVTRWLKSEGEEVAVDEPLLEVSTDKVDTEIPSPAAGVLQRILVQEDETVDVGAELAVIADASDDGSSGEGEQQESDQPAQQQGGAEDPADPAAVDSPTEQAQQAASPAQQQSAREASGDQGGGASAGTPVTMPALGESVTEGTVTRWLKSEGEQVSADEPLLEVSTDKVDTEIPSPISGTVQKILVQEDETVDVGTDLAIIGTAAEAEQPSQPEQQDAGQPEQQDAGQPEQQDAGQPEQQDAEMPSEQADGPVPQEPAAPVTSEAPAQAATSAQPASPSPESQPQAQQTSPDSSASSDGDAASTYVTPLVRKLANQHGVELSSLSGTGVGGRIRKQDVLDAAAQAKERAAPSAGRDQAVQQPAAQSPAQDAPAGGAVSPLRGKTEKVSRLRKVIAARMVESLQTSAQLTTVVEVDLTKVARLRDRAKTDFEAREGVKLSFLPFMAKATVDALKAHPVLNASIDTDKGEITYYDSEHLGIAVDTDRGLLVPVLRDAGDLNIAGLARKVADLAARTRNNKITPDELAGATFTLTNTGSRGALFDTPIFTPPQVGILGTGAVVKRPVVVEDANLGETIAIRSMCYLALSYDHRLVDGADAARFLSTVKARLEEGAFEADLGL